MIKRRINECRASKTNGCAHSIIRQAITDKDVKQHATTCTIRPTKSNTDVQGQRDVSNFEQVKKSQDGAAQAVVTT